MAGGRELKLAISIAGRLDKSLGQAANQAQAQLNSISKTANKYAVRASAAIAIATTKYVKESIETYTEYEDALNSAAAVFDVKKGTEQYEALAAAARKVPQETIVSAKEGADALKYMALAGWSVEDSINAVIPVVKLAAATEMEIGRASDLITDSMMAMGMSYDQVGHYVDLLAKGNNSANYNAEQLLESLTSVGGVFRQLNISAEDGAALLGVLASQGTKGAEAGTGMNTVLTRMQKRSGEAAKGMEMLGLSMFNADGSARNILDVFQEMHDKTADMTTEEMSLALTMIGGQKGIRVLSKLMEGYNQVTEDGIPLVQYLAQAYRNADGALDNFYDIKTDTMQGLMSKLDRLKETMQINTIEAISPQMTELLNHIMDKMPDIENAVVGVFTNAMPYVKRFLDFIIDNFDKVVKGAYDFMRIFWGLKIGTGALRGITNLTTLFVNLGKLASARGILTVLKGVLGTFTGISTAGSAISGIVGTLTSTLGPIALIAGGLAGVVAAGILIEKNFNYSKGLDKYTSKIKTASEELIKYNDLAAELQNQKDIILNPKSSTEEIENARTKIEEIAKMLGVDYSMDIDCDTTELDAAIEKQQMLSRKEMIDEGGKYLKKAQGGAEKYLNDTKEIELADSMISRYGEIERIYGNLSTEADLYYSGLESGLTTEAEYIQKVNDLYHDAMNSGIIGALYGDDITGMSQVIAFRNKMAGLNDNAELTKSNYEANKANAEGRQKEWLENAETAAAALTSALASDVSISDDWGIKTDIEFLTQLGDTMTKAGANTDALAVQFAAARLGFTDFDAALGEGGQNAHTIAQNYIDFKNSIGDTAENAVAGAAVIANGFSSIEAAAQASSGTMSAILNDMLAFGNSQGLFEGLNTEGVTSKLTEMAHAMNLIPDNKVIQINAEGNLEIVEQAEDKLANMDDSAAVTIDAQDNATQKAQEVSDKVADLDKAEANPNINATDNASSVIASVSRSITNLDGKTATVFINTVQNQTKKSARGAKDFSGGLTYVNDQKGVNDAREVIEYGNMRWWYEGQNVLANIPRGARIYTAAQSKAFINGSHENGLDRVPFDGYIAELHEGERVLTANEAAGYNRIDFNGMLDVLADMIMEMRSGGGGNDAPQGGGRFVFSPTYHVTGGDEQTVRKVARMSFDDFKEYMEEYEHENSRKRF